MFSTGGVPDTTDFLLLSGAMLVGMLLSLGLGRRLGRRRMLRDPEGAGQGIGTVESAIFALFGLLLAFTFSGAAGRFDMRRALINEEANAIGTAWLRLDLLPQAHQPELKDHFRRYVDARLRIGHSGKAEDLAETKSLQGAIWQLALRALNDYQGPPITNAVLDPINQMIDITGTRWTAAQTHPPAIIFVMLFLLAQVSALLAGYGMGLANQRQTLHSFALALIVSGTFYVILDIEHPRAGLIRVDTADQVLRNLLADMQAPPAH